MKRNIASDTFGDSKEFSVLNKIVDILIELNDDNKFIYCARLLEKYRKSMKSINSLDKKARMYLLCIIKDDYRKKISVESNKGNIPKNLYTHLDNLIVGLYRKEYNMLIFTKNEQ